MKRILYFFAIALLVVSCQKMPVMTKQGFASIEPGTDIHQVEKLYGKPFSIHSKDGNSVVYEYIERILMGPETIAQYRYYLVVSNGKVVGKYTKYSTPPAFEQIFSDDPYPNY
jgi:hypothetical protein